MSRQYQNLENVVTEYSIAKVCSILEKAGISVGSPDQQFDLVCYDDSIEFFIERGTLLKSKVFTRAEADDIEEQLKHCVKVIHSFRIPHKDIKPENILIDWYGKGLLTNINISTFVAEQPGQKSLTCKEGTIGRSQCSLSVDAGKVDLSYNDMYALKHNISNVMGQVVGTMVNKKDLLKTALKGANQLKLLFTKNIASWVQQAVMLIPYFWHTPSYTSELFRRELAKWTHD